MNVYEVVNERIDALLAQGVVPWRRPWKADVGRPRSIDGRPYHGINAFLLANVGHADPRFATFARAKAAGWRIKKGARGYPVVFWRQIEIVEGEGDEAVTKTVPLLRYYTVFNVEQIEGDVPPLDVEARSFDPIERAEAIVEGMPQRPSIVERGTAAYYRVAEDLVVLPPRSSFESGAGWYATLFHELGHSTGHPERLNRPELNNFEHFGSQMYSREELVAEFCSAYLLAHAGIDDEIPSSASYIDAWRRAIRDDSRALVVAASRGQRAAEFILGEAYGEVGALGGA